MDAVLAAAKANRYTDQGLKPWTTQRAFVFQMKEGPIPVEVGGYASSGYSYTEIAGMSRSRHESQAMGTAQPVGPSRVYLEPVIPKNFSGDFLDGIGIGRNGFLRRWPDLSRPLLRSLIPKVRKRLFRISCKREEGFVACRASR